MFKRLDVVSMTKNEFALLSKPITIYNNISIDHAELKYRLPLSHPSNWVNSKFHEVYANMGDLSRFPVEILQHLFASTDVQTLMNLRATNSAMKFHIESWAPFRAAMTDARVAVRALLATKAAYLWTFSELHAIMYKTTCHYCGEHGEILHLLKMQRTCIRCVTTNRKLLAVNITYAMRDMALEEIDLVNIPKLITIQQRNFWGKPMKSGLILLDYSTALEIAMAYHRTGHLPKTVSPKLRSQIPFRKFNTGIWQEEDVRLKSRRLRKSTLLCLRRERKFRIRIRQHIKRSPMRLPQFLVNPPETSNEQHACCVYLPTLMRPTSTSPALMACAFLCAGCSLYFNYHNLLPYQCHTLYPHPCQHETTRTSMERVTSSPLINHLNSCPWAQLFHMTFITPLHLLPYPTNPSLVANGGIYTAVDLSLQLRIHRYFIEQHGSIPRLRLRRHIIDENGLHIDVEVNNENFEHLPVNLTALPYERMPPPTTALEAELVIKIAQADPTITTSGDDKYFDAWTRARLIDLQLDDKERMTRIANAPVDPEGFVNLISNEAMSQASWALARPSHASCLFRGWTALVEERRREFYGVFEDNPRRHATRFMLGEEDWGMDRWSD